MNEPTILLNIDLTEDELMRLIEALESGAKNVAALAACKSLLVKIIESLESQAALQAGAPSQIAR
jgi:hypothetical protein